MKRKVLITCLSAIALLVTAEIGARLSGVVDFPVYATDDRLGYIIKPNQSGRFLNKNAWFFNEKSMPTEDAWAPTKRPNILLIGNSIVMGGNAYDQKDKLEPLISKEIGPAYSIWPIATGGWSNVNEVEYLRRNPDVVQAANFFVWEYMYGGLHELSKWRGEYVFPTKHPLVASWYVFRRYLLPRLVPVNMDELPPSGTLDPRNLEDFDATVARLSLAAGAARAGGSMIPGIILLYPDKARLAAARNSEEWLPDRRTLEDVCRRYNLKLIDVAKNPEWTDTLYRGGTHPTEEGNAVLAHIVASAIQQTLSENQRLAAAAADVGKVRFKNHVDDIISPTMTANRIPTPRW